MGDNARRKQRQKLKRQKKRGALRRAVGPSPYSKLKQAGDIEACYINEGWEEEGIASILVLRALPGGGYVMGAFLVDFMCIGLKDCWGRIDISKSEFRESLERMRERMDVVRISAEEAWELVAGGVRWSQENGFRLPPRYERWISVLGNPADCASADISSFGEEDGGLLYTGSIEDLRKRLIGCTLEQFMAREDVKIISHDLDPSLLDEIEEDEDSDDDRDDEEDLAELAEADEAVEELVAVMRSRTLDGVRKFLFGRSIQPHPRLGEAVDLMVESIMQAPGIDAEEEEEGEEIEQIEAAGANLDRFMSMESPESRAQLKAASEQLEEYMRQFKDPEDMFKSLGLDKFFEE